MWKGRLALPRHDQRVSCLASELASRDPRVARAALRALADEVVPEAFAPAWQLYRDRGRLQLDRREQLMALRLAFRADPDLALYVFAPILGQRRGWAWGRRRVRESQEHIVHTLVTCAHPASRDALRYYAAHGRGRVRQLCRLALACGGAAAAAGAAPRARQAG
jgi:hypothetical protein